jgi:hypothetical protein
VKLYVGSSIPAVANTCADCTDSQSSTDVCTDANGASWVFSAIETAMKEIGWQGSPLLVKSSLASCHTVTRPADKAVMPAHILQPPPIFQLAVSNSLSSVNPVTQQYINSICRHISRRYDCVLHVCCATRAASGSSLKLLRRAVPHRRTKSLSTIAITQHHFVKHSSLALQAPTTGCTDSLRPDAWCSCFLCSVGPSRAVLCSTPPWR